MATLLTCPDRLTSAQRASATTLYLAGPFEDGTSTWRDQVIDAFDDLDIVIIDPRNDRWDDLEIGSAGRRGAYDWQCEAAFTADVVLVWVPDGGVDPTALLILGYLGAKRSNAARGSSVVVAGDGIAGLALLFAQNHRLFPVGDDLAELVRIGRLQVEEAMRTTA